MGPDSGVVVLDHAWRWGWGWKRGKRRDQERGPRVDDQGWMTKGKLIRGHRIRCSNSLVASCLSLSFCFSPFSDLSYGLLEYIFCSSPRVISAGHSSTHFITTGTTTAMTTIPSLQGFPVALKWNPGIDLANDPGLTLICRPSRYYRIAEITPWLIYLAPDRFFPFVKLLASASFAREGLNGWRDWRAHFVRSQRYNCPVLRATWGDYCVW